MSHKKPRLPFAPLAEYARLRYRAPDETVHVMAGSVAWVEQALSYQWKHSTVHTWMKLGVPIGQADAVATELGHHPTYIWPEYGREAAA